MALPNKNINKHQSQRQKPAQSNFSNEKSNKRKKKKTIFLHWTKKKFAPFATNK
jgi:hypothetical protein